MLNINVLCLMLALRVLGQSYAPFVVFVDYDLSDNHFRFISGRFVGVFLFLLCLSVSSLTCRYVGSLLCRYVGTCSFCARRRFVGTFSRLSVDSPICRYITLAPALALAVTLAPDTTALLLVAGSLASAYVGFCARRFVSICSPLSRYVSIVPFRYLTTLLR